MQLGIISKIKNFIAIFYILYSIFSLPVFAATPELLKTSIDQKAKELEEINKKVQETQDKIEQAQDQKKTLTKEAQRLDYTVNQLDLSIRSSQINIQKINFEIDSLQYDIQGKENAILQNRQAISSLVRTLHQKDKESLLLALMKNRSLAESVAEIQGVSNLNQSLGTAIVSLRQLRGELQQVLENKGSKKTQLEIENGNLKNRQVIVSEQKKEKDGLLAQTKNQEKLYQQQLQDLEKRQAAISDDLEKIEDELRRSFDPTLLPLKRPGVLAMPLRNPRLTQNYGEVSWLYRGKPHNGADFGAIVGTEIFAADDGMILKVENNGRYQYGKYILIKHDNNLTTLYAHLSRQIVKDGQRVRRGELIGYSGNTGYAVGRGHLHLGLYWSPSVILKNFPSCNCGLVPVGVTINPLDYL